MWLCGTDPFTVRSLSRSAKSSVTATAPVKCTWVYGCLIAVWQFRRRAEKRGEENRPKHREEKKKRPVSFFKGGVRTPPQPNQANGVSTNEAPRTIHFNREWVGVPGAVAVFAGKDVSVGLCAMRIISHIHNPRATTPIISTK